MKKILILTSCEPLWLLYEKELQKNDCTVVTQSCRSNYLQKIQRMKPELIITDNLLPPEKQKFILCRIRKNCRELPIILHRFPSGNSAELPDLFLAKTSSLSELKHKTLALLTVQEVPPVPATETYLRG